MIMKMYLIFVFIYLIFEKFKKKKHNNITFYLVCITWHKVIIYYVTLVCILVANTLTYYAYDVILLRNNITL